MAISYIISHRKNSISADKNSQYFIKLVQNNTIGIDQICKEIEKESSLSASDIYATVIALQNKMMQHLENGHAVDLEFLGKFSLAAKTKAQPYVEEVSAKDIQKLHINFLPSGKVKHWLKQNFKLKKV